MTDSDRLSPDSMAALQARFQGHSQKAQTYYAVMHEVRNVLGSDGAADSWMTSPNDEMNGSTPAQLVNQGRTDEVLACIRRSPSRPAR